MRTFIVVFAAFAVALAFCACKKKEEAPTAETVAAPAVTVDEARAELKGVLEAVETLRAGAEKPTPELAQSFKDNVATLEELKGKLTSEPAPEAEAAAYAEATAKVDAAIEGVTGLAKLTEMEMAKGKPEMTEKERQTFSENARASFVEACEYAAPEIAAKMKPPAPEPPK